MKEELLAILRDREKGVAAFRKAADKLVRVLVEEMFERLQGVGISGEEIIVVPILRSGMVFISPCANEMSGVPVGILGIKRNEKTAEPKLYYKHLPKRLPPVALIVDPMLATGGSALCAVDLLVEKGMKAENIHFLGIIAAQEGVARLARKIPRDNILVAAVDPKLDAQKFIVPGLGDFGDRYFGTPA